MTSQQISGRRATGKSSWSAAKTDEITVAKGNCIRAQGR